MNTLSDKLEEYKIDLHYYEGNINPITKRLEEWIAFRSTCYGYKSTGSSVVEAVDKVIIQIEEK